MKAWQRPLDLLEAAYWLDGSDDDWMRELVATMGAVFVHGGLGAAGFVISGRIDEAGRTVIAQIRIPHVVGSGGGPGNEGLDAVRGYPQLPPDLQQRLFFSSDTASTTSVVSGLGPKMNKEPVWTKSGLESIGASDGLGLNCHENPMDTVVLAAALREVTSLTKSEVRLWQRIDGIRSALGAALDATKGGAAKLRGHGVVARNTLVRLHDTMTNLLPQIRHWLRTGHVASGKIINLCLARRSSARVFLDGGDRGAAVRAPMRPRTQRSPSDRPHNSQLRRLEPVSPSRLRSAGHDASQGKKRAGTASRNGVS